MGPSVAVRSRQLDGLLHRIAFHLSILRTPASSGLELRCTLPPLVTVLYHLLS